MTMDPGVKSPPFKLPLFIPACLPLSAPRCAAFQCFWIPSPMSVYHLLPMAPNRSLPRGPFLREWRSCEESALGVDMSRPQKQLLMTDTTI